MRRRLLLLFMSIDLAGYSGDLGLQFGFVGHTVLLVSAGRDCWCWMLTAKSSTRREVELKKQEVPRSAFLQFLLTHSNRSTCQPPTSLLSLLLSLYTCSFPTKLPMSMQTACHSTTFELASGYRRSSRGAPLSARRTVQYALGRCCSPNEARRPEMSQWQARQFNMTRDLDMLGLLRSLMRL